nr:Clp protease N-terminal domain-containing protein [Micromonospora sp. DSM 115978]
MPKINVYLPDELAEAVKAAGVPVSAVCQRALEQAVRRVTAIRETTLSDVDDADLAAKLPNFTPRARTALRLAIDQARSAGSPGATSGHLLGGVLTEGANLALHVLRAVDIEPGRVGEELARQPGAEGEAAADDGGLRFSAPAAAALELAVTEATTFGHNYVGCEHLLLGLIGEPDGVAGRVLRGMGAEPRLTRRAVAAALAGYVHLRAQTAQPPAPPPSPAAAPAAVADAVRRELQPLIGRIERLEERFDAADGA